MSRVSNFRAGLKTPWRGFRYLLAHPKLLKYAIPPAIINGTLLVLSLASSIAMTSTALSWAWELPSGEAWYVWLLQGLWWLVWLITASVLSVIGVVIVYLLAIPISGPFNEMLSEGVEEIETGFSAPFDLQVMLRNVVTSAAHVGIVFVFQAFIFLLTSLIGLIPVVGQVIAALVGGVCTPSLVGFAPFDYPMTVRLWSLSDKLRFVRRNFAGFYGFSLASFVLLYIPFVNLLFLPSCVVGATLFLLDMEKAGELDDLRDRRKESLAARGKIPLTQVRPETAGISMPSHIEEKEEAEVVVEEEVQRR